MAHLTFSHEQLAGLLSMLILFLTFRVGLRRGARSALEQSAAEWLAPPRVSAGLMWAWIYLPTLAYRLALAEAIGRVQFPVRKPEQVLDEGVIFSWQGHHFRIDKHGVWSVVTYHHGKYFRPLAEKEESLIRVCQKELAIIT